MNVNDQEVFGSPALGSVSLAGIGDGTVTSAIITTKNENDARYSRVQETERKALEAWEETLKAETLANTAIQKADAVTRSLVNIDSDVTRANTNSTNAFNKATEAIDKANAAANAARSAQSTANSASATATTANTTASSALSTANAAGTSLAVSGRTISLKNKNGTVISSQTTQDTWNANSKTVPGYVAAPGAVANKVWKTDASGNPGWRDDADTKTVVNNTLTSSSTTEALSANQGRVLAGRYNKSYILADTLGSRYVYVDCVSGNDSNAGTSSAPFRTLDAAFNYCDKNGSDFRIFLARAGTYTWNYSVFSNVSLHLRKVNDADSITVDLAGRVVFYGGHINLSGEVGSSSSNPIVFTTSNGKGYFSLDNCNMHATSCKFDCGLDSYFGWYKIIGNSTITGSAYTADDWSVQLQYSALTCVGNSGYNPKLNIKGKIKAIHNSDVSLTDTTIVNPSSSRSDYYFDIRNSTLTFVTDTTIPSNVKKPMNLDFADVRSKSALSQTGSKVSHSKFTVY